MARIRIALCTDGWQDLLERSLRLQMVVEPASCARTANYRIEGLLRTDMLDAAENAIAANARAITRHDAFSRAMLNVYRADLARRRGVCWSDDFVDGAPLPEREPTFPIGLYELAVARQSARPRSERARRLERAVLAFRSRGGDAASGPLEILSATTRLGIAEARGSVRLVEQAREGLRAIGSRGPIAERLARGAAAGLDFGALCDSLPWC